VRNGTDYLQDGDTRSGLVDRLLLTLVAAVIMVALGLLSDGQYKTAEAAPPAPPATTSRYMSTVDSTTVKNEGIAQGQAGESGVIVLDFGQPQYGGGVYGTWLFNSTFAPISSIEGAADRFLDGFFYNSPSNVYIHLAVGTSNDFGYTSTGHGQAWAQMVNRVGTYLNTPPTYAGKETVDGASDMETGWSNASLTRAWADGYNSAHNYPYYDYGDAGGCPPYGTCYPWTQEDVYYVSWGVAPAWPLPEIYYSSLAAQWYQMSLYAYTYHGSKMLILGSLTGGGSNTAAQGWSQLYDALNADSRTAWTPTWSTNI
jgi:hypothetical protein